MFWVGFVVLEFFGVFDFGFSFVVGVGCDRRFLVFVLVRFVVFCSGRFEVVW